MKHRELILLYFELEKLLQQDRKDEVELAEKIINEYEEILTTSLDFKKYGSGISREAQRFLGEKLIPIRDKIIKTDTPPNSEAIKVAGVIMKALKNLLGRDLEDILQKRRELEIEDIARNTLKGDEKA